MKPERHLLGTSLDELREIIRLTQGTSAAPHLRIDPSLARGLSYYTGAIMEIAVPDLAGSLGGGGRYDGLVGMFSGEQVPACGFSLGLERILVVMTERGMFPATLTTAPADVLVTLWSAERTPDALTVAASLRSGGVRVDVYPEADKLGKQFKYAAARGFPFVIVMGDDEAARGEVTVKDMKSGEQRSVGRQEVDGAAQEDGCIGSRLQTPGTLWPRRRQVRSPELEPGAWSLEPMRIDWLTN